MSAQLQFGGKQHGSVNAGAGANVPFLFRKVTSAKLAVPDAGAEDVSNDDGDERGEALYDDATLNAQDTEADVEASGGSLVRSPTVADRVHAIKVANELGEVREVELSKSPTGADMQLLVDAQCVFPSNTIPHGHSAYSSPSVEHDSFARLCSACLSSSGC